MSREVLNTDYQTYQNATEDVWDSDCNDIFNKKLASTMTSDSEIPSGNQLNISFDKDSQNGIHVNSSEKSSDGSRRSSKKYSISRPGKCVRRVSTNENSLASTADSPNANSKMEKINACISTPIVNLDKLHELSWSGVPNKCRPIVWKLLMDYLPPNKGRQETSLTDKRKQYHEYMTQYYSRLKSPDLDEILLQITKDTKRMTLIYGRQQLIDMFERVLYTWSKRHPASGYVQGMNDLLTPYFIVFLSEYVACDVDGEGRLILRPDNGAVIPPDNLARIEADVFWCVTRLLDSIQENYTFPQLGIQRNIQQLQRLVGRVDAELHAQLSTHGVEYLQFAFRWMNNLLLRELPLLCCVRLWDTYMAEPDGFSKFHVYVCAAFLLKFSANLKNEPDFQGILLFLQHLPTRHWRDEEMSLILADAFRLQTLFANARSHLEDTDASLTPSTPSDA